MENFLLLLNSIIYSWMSPSSVDIAMDLSIAVICGVGLFFILIPFLKDCPLSPASGNKTDIAKDVKRKQNNTRKKTDTGKGCRDGRKNVEETKTPSQPMKILTRKHFQDITLQPFWNSSQKTDHLPLSQLLSSLTVLEDLILQKFNRLFWGTSSIFSESVVAMAQVLRNPCFAQRKSVRFVDPCVPARAPSQAQGPGQYYQYQLPPHRLRKPNLAGVTWVPEKKILPSFNPKHPCLKSRAYGVSYPTTEKGIQISGPTERLSHKHGLYYEDNKGYANENHQKAIRKPPGNLHRDTLNSKVIRSASILLEHLQMLRSHKGPPSKDKATNVGEQQGCCLRFLPSKKLKQLQEHFPANTDHYYKRRAQLCQPGQPSSLNSRSYKLGKMMGSVLAGLTLKKDTAKWAMKPQVFHAAQPSIYNSKSYKCSKRMGSAPKRVHLKKDTAKCDRGRGIKKGIGTGAKNVPRSSRRIPGKGLKVRNWALRTDELSDISSSDSYSLGDSKADRKLASSNRGRPVKRRRTPYLQILDALDLTPPEVPASKLHRIVFPSSPICDSKEEYYSKAAIVLENLHHQDPGGTRVESASAARLESALSMHSAAEVQETQRAHSPEASHGPSKFHPDPLQRHLSIHRPAFYFQAKPQHGRIIRGVGKGSLQPNTNRKKAKHAPIESFHEEDSRHHSWNVRMVCPGERVPPSVAKQTKTLEVKEETPCASSVSLGSSKIHNVKDINLCPRVFGSSGANRSPGHLQTRTPQHSQDSTLKTQAFRKLIPSSNKQSQPRRVRHDREGPSTVQPAKVSLSSEHSMSSFQSACQKPKTTQGSCDVFLRRHDRADTKENRVLKDKIGIKHLKGFYPHLERQSSVRSIAISQGERLGRARPSSLSSTQLKDTAKTRTSGKREVTGKSSWKDYPRKVLKYGYAGCKDIGEGDSSKTDQQPAAAEQTQEVWTKKKSIYNMISELQYLINFLLEILGDTERNRSEVQGCEVESRTFQLGSSCHSSESVSDTKHSTTASSMSCGHTSPKMHNCFFTKRGIRDKTQSGIKAKTACDQHLYQVNRGMSSDQLPIPKEYDLSGRFRRIQHQQGPGLTDQTCYQCKINEKLGMTHCPHGSSKGHERSFRYRKIGDKPQPGFAHKDFDRHQSRKEGMGCDSCLSPKGHRPVKHKGADCFSA